MNWSLIILVSLLVLWVLMLAVGILLIFGKLDWVTFIRSINELQGSRTKFSRGTTFYYKMYSWVLGGASIVLSLYMIHFTISFYLGKGDILNLPTILTNIMYAYSSFVLGK